MTVKTLDKRAYYGIRLSENIIEDTNKQLICANVPIARTGPQDYYGIELSDKLEPNKVYRIERYPKDVFAEEFMASLENIPYVDMHPDQDVFTDTSHKDLALGFLRNIHKGKMDIRGLEDKYYDKDGNNVLYGDLVVTDKDMIKFIRTELEKKENDREIDLSLGYDAEYIPTADYVFTQKPTNGNHIARVPKGRAGIAKIRDAAMDPLQHTNKYFRNSFPFPFESGLKRLGITDFNLKIMTPDEYFNELVFKAKTNLIDDILPTDNEQINSMKEHLNEGNQFDIPYILYSVVPGEENKQDGRHRVALMKIMGINNVPVLIFYKTRQAEQTTIDNAIKTKDILPKKDETEKEFISRFMSNEEMKKEYPEEKQRVAVAYSYWRKGTKDMDPIVITFKDAIYHMEGFTDQKEAKEFAIILHKTMDVEYNRELTNQIGDVYDFIENIWKEWDNVSNALSKALKHKLNLEKALKIDNKTLYQSTDYNHNQIRNKLDELNKNINFFKEAIDLSNKVKGKSTFNEIKSIFQSSKYYDLPENEKTMYEKGQSVKVRGPMDMYLDILNGKVTRIRF